MKKFLLALFLCLPFALMAQQKVAVVNSQQIMAAMPEVKTAETKLQDLSKKYDADIKSMQDELQKKAEVFTKEKDKMVEAIRLRKQQELEDIQLRIQQSYQAMQEDLQKQQAQLLQPIQTKVMASVKKVADSLGIAYVLETAMLVYQGASALDITDKVKADLGVK